MNRTKQQALKRRGWAVGSAADFLDLLVRALLLLGATKESVARTIESARLPHAA